PSCTKPAASAGSSPNCDAEIGNKALGVRMAILISLYVLASAALLADPQITTERVFGPELPGRYKHPASITELDNGDLYLVYYGGSGEYADDSGVYGARLAKGKSEWSKPKRIMPQPKFPEG